MKKRVAITISLSLLLITLVLLSFSSVELKSFNLDKLTSGPITGYFIRNDLGGGLYNYTCSNCTDCTAAIANASNYPGSTVYLNQSISNYTGGTCVDFAGADNVTFDCGGFNNFIDGNDSGASYGIYLNSTGDGSNYNTIKNCNVSDFIYGVYFRYSSNNLLTNITSTSNSNEGLYFYESSNNNLTNMISSYNTGTGVYLTANSNSNNFLILLTNSNNGWGVYVSLSGYNNFTNVLSRKNINDGIGSNHMGNSIFRDVTLSLNQRDGIRLFGTGTKLNSFFNVTSDGNLDGVYIERAENNTFVNSTFKNNTEYGLYINRYSSPPPITYYSDDNIFYNNLFNNTVNYYNTSSDSITNYFNTTLRNGTNIIGGNFIGGNYWDNYSAPGTGFSATCTDADVNGICDDAYNVDGVGQSWDYLPLSSFEPPTEINTIEDLNNTRNDLSGNYILMNDLNFSDCVSYDDCGNMAEFTTGEGWIPIGNSTTGFRFEGSFDGQNYTISNAYMNKSTADYNDVGLFGATEDAMIKNLKLSDFTLYAYNSGSGVFWHIGGLVANSNNTNFTNIYGSNFIFDLNTFDGGVFVGSATYSNFYRISFTNSTIISRNPGVVSDTDSSSFSSSYVRNVNLKGSQAGAFSGRLDNSNITNSYVLNVTINGSGDYNGGFFAGGQNNIVTNSYVAYSNISSSTNRMIGGISAYIYGSSLVNNSFVSNIFLKDGEYVGGIVGYNNGVILDSYWHNVSDGAYSCHNNGEAGCTAILSSDYFENTSNSPMDSWDFISVWEQDTSVNNGLPYLKWQTISLSSDTTSPTVIINSPASTTYSSSTITFNATATGASSSVSSCWYSLNSGTTNTTLTNSAGNYYTNSQSLADNSYTAQFYCNDTSGDLNDTESVSFTVSTSTVDDDSSSSGGGGGGTTTPPVEEEDGATEVVNGTADTSFDTMNPNETSTIEINDSDFGLTQISMNVSEEISGASISITEVDNRDDASLMLGVGEDFATFEAFNVEKNGISNDNISEVTLNFRVTKEWAQEKFGGMAGFAKYFVRMYKRETVNDTWEEVETSFLSEDDTYYYYEATSDGFSIFVIGLDTSILRCEIGEERCVEGSIRKCVEYGNETSWDLLKVCDNGCKDANSCAGFKFDVTYLIFGGLVLVFAGLIIVIIKFSKDKPKARGSSEKKVSEAKKAVSKYVDKDKKKKK